MTLDEALKEIETLKLQNKTLTDEKKSQDEKYNLLNLELELAKACHNEKCAEFNKLCYDYYKLTQKNKQLKSDALKEFVDWFINNKLYKLDASQLGAYINESDMKNALKEYNQEVTK